MKPTLVIGASTNPNRYSFMAINMLNQYGHTVFAIGSKLDHIGALEITTELKPFENIDTITLYINPKIQSNYIDYIYSLNPKRIIFNPGTEHPSFMKEAIAKGIKCEEACTLVLLRIGSY